MYVNVCTYVPSYVCMYSTYVRTSTTALLFTAVLRNECCAVLCCAVLRTCSTAGGIAVYNYEMREDVCKSKFTGGGTSLLWAPQQVMEGGEAWGGVGWG